MKFYFLNFYLWKKNYPDNNALTLLQNLDVNIALEMFKEMVCKILGDGISISLIENKDIFEDIYTKNVSAGDWKTRSEEEKEKIFSNFYVFKTGEKILGGVCLTLKDDEIFLECLYVSETGKGYGSLILKYVTSLGFPVITFSKKGGFFEKFGFEKVECEVSVTGAEKYKFKTND